MRALPFVVACAFLTGCSRNDPPTPTTSAPKALPKASASTALPRATVFPSATPRPPTEAPSSVEDTVSKQLRTAPITALEIVSWSKPGLFHASLERPNQQAPARVTLTLALDQSPIAYRRPYAYALLARELGMRVVPATVVRRVTTGELGAFFTNEPDVSTYLAAHASVQNDGTIAALVIAPSRGEAPRAWEQVSRRVVVLDEAPEARAWAAWAASSEPATGENAALLRDYVDTLVLDYLSANIMRRSVLLDDAASEILVAENDGAFQPKIDPRAEERLLDRLRPVVRFPRSLRDALNRLTRARARELLTPGDFDEWLVSPRSLMNFDERRVSLLTLIEARVVELGEQAVLSL